MSEQPERDKCMFCLGAKGGAPGNENRLGSVVMCDDCTVLYRIASEAEQKEFPDNFRLLRPATEADWNAWRDRKGGIL